MRFVREKLIHVPRLVFSVEDFEKLNRQFLVCIEAFTSLKQKKITGTRQLNISQLQIRQMDKRVQRLAGKHDITLLPQ